MATAYSHFRGTVTEADGGQAAFVAVRLQMEEDINEYLDLYFCKAASQLTFGSFQTNLATFKTLPAGLVSYYREKLRHNSLFVTLLECWIIL